MGLYVPASKLAGWGVKPAGTGHLAFLSQSGGHGEILTAYAQSLGVYFSKIISFGNACGLQVADFLDYLHQDPDTHIISIYLEGIKDGNRVTRLIKDINRSKPVIIWKAGLTESGSRAVASHTGSLAGNGLIWDAFFKQTGAIRVNSLEEIIDVVLAFQYLKPSPWQTNPPPGRRRRQLGGFCRYLRSPGPGDTSPFRKNQERTQYLRPPGRKQHQEPPRSLDGSKRCPTLSPGHGNSPGRPGHRSGHCQIGSSAVLICLMMMSTPEGDQEKGLREVNDFLIEFCHEQSLWQTAGDFHGPVRQRSATVADMAAQLRRKFVTSGVPAYPSLEIAARAMSRFVNYHEFQRKHGNSTR